MRVILLVPAALVAAGVATLAAQQHDSVPPVPAPTALAAGVFSDSQATVGESVYRNECGRCHLIADHSGADFQANWNGRTVRSLFDYLRSTMPDDDPGALSDDEYLAAIAYILRVNGMPSGQAALTTDTTVLGKARIDIKWPRQP